MTCYLIEPRDQIFVKCYRLLPFPRNMNKNIGKNFSCKNSQKLLDHAKQSATDPLKVTSKRVKVINETKKLDLKYQKQDIYLQEKENKLLMS